MSVRRWIGLGVLAAVWLQAVPARAEETLRDTQDRKESPRWWALELKFGPYWIDVDKEFSGSTHPYRDIFGRRPGLMSQITVDLEFLKKHGVLAVGGTVGIFSRRGKALTEAGEESGDYTGLNVVPLILQLVYRWDYPVHRWHVPLVPYVRAGIVYAFYWITDGSGGIAHFGPTGHRARGGKWGYQVNAGLAFLMDVLEPGVAKKMDADSGLNHIYLFCEFVHSRIDDFGSRKAMRIGQELGLLAGFTFEF